MEDYNGTLSLPRSLKKMYVIANLSNYGKYKYCSLSRLFLAIVTCPRYCYLLSNKIFVPHPHPSFFSLSPPVSNICYTEAAFFRSVTKREETIHFLCSVAGSRQFIVKAPKKHNLLKYFRNDDFGLYFPSCAFFADQRW